MSLVSSFFYLAIGSPQSMFCHFLFHTRSALLYSSTGIEFGFIDILSSIRRYVVHYYLGNLSFNLGRTVVPFPWVPLDASRKHVTKGAPRTASWMEVETARRIIFFTVDTSFYSRESWDSGTHATRGRCSLSELSMALSGHPGTAACQPTTCKYFSEVPRSSAAEWN